MWCSMLRAVIASLNFFEVNVLPRSEIITLGTPNTEIWCAISFFYGFGCIGCSLGDHVKKHVSLSMMVKQWLNCSLFLMDIRSMFRVAMRPLGHMYFWVGSSAFLLFCSSSMACTFLCIALYPFPSLAKQKPFLLS